MTTAEPISARPVAAVTGGLGGIGDAQHPPLLTDGPMIDVRLLRKRMD
jgi:hypothetical protein